MAKQASTPDVRLFAPRQSYRLHALDNAILNYSLKAAPKKTVEIKILDSKGATIRKLTTEGQAGLNRVTWDMRYESPRPIALRTIPPEDPHIWEEERFKGKDSRPITHWGMPDAPPGPLVAPGKYTVKLTVDGASSQQPLEVLIDPHTAGTQQSIEATLKLQLRIRDDVDRASDMVNQIEWMRKQLSDIEKMLAANDRESQLLKDAKDTDQKMQGVEYQLLSKDLAASDDKYYISAYKVYYNLLWLDAEVGSGAGDVAGAGDYGPTDTSPQLLAGIEKDLAHAAEGYHELMTNTVPAFNRELSSKGVIPVAATIPPPATDSATRE